MAIQNKILWTVLPNGFNKTGDKLRLSVQVSPRLVTDGVGNSGAISEFPLFIDWPSTLRNLQFIVEIKSGPPPFTGNIISFPPPPVNRLDDPPLESDFWTSLFPSNVPVSSFNKSIIDDKAKKAIRSYPVKKVHSFLKNIYQTTAIKSADRIPGKDFFCFGEGFTKPIARDFSVTITVDSNGNTTSISINGQASNSISLRQFTTDPTPDPYKTIKQQLGLLKPLKFSIIENIKPKYGKVSLSDDIVTYVLPTPPPECKWSAHAVVHPQWPAGLPDSFTVSFTYKARNSHGIGSNEAHVSITVQKATGTPTPPVLFDEADAAVGGVGQPGGGAEDSHRSCLSSIAIYPDDEKAMDSRIHSILTERPHAISHDRSQDTMMDLYQVIQFHSLLSPLKVVSTNPTDGATGIAQNQVVSVVFNRAVASTSIILGTTVTVSPAIAQLIAYVDPINPSQVDIDPHGNNWGGGVKYTITFKAGGVQDKSGLSLVSPYGFSFTATPPPPPPPAC